MENVGDMELDSYFTTQLLSNFSTFSSKKILIVDRIYALDHSYLLPEYLDKNKDYDIIVFDDATPYVRNCQVQKMYENVVECNIKTPWIIITSDFNYYKSHEKNIVYYPYHLLFSVAYSKNTEINIRQLRNYFIGFLPWHLHELRLVTIIKLYQQKWFDKCLINYFPKKTLTPFQLEILQRSMNNLSSVESTLLQEFNDNFPNGMLADTSEEFIDLNSLNNKANTDCYINLMIESEYNLPFITEKTIKPYLCGQFSAVLGNNFLYKHLQNLGIDTLQDYLEMQVWNLDPRQTIDTILNRLSDLIVNIEQSWIDTYPRRLDNYYYVRSDKFINKLDDGIKEWLT